MLIRSFQAAWMICMCAIVALDVRELCAADTITNFQVVRESNNGLIISVRYNYDSSHGDWVFIGASAQTAGGANIGTGYRPWPIRAGNGYAYIELIYSGAVSTSSPKISVYMYEGGLDIFHTADFNHNKTWTAQSDAIFVPDFKTTSQNAKDLNFDVSYTLLSSHTRAVRLGAEALRNGTVAASFGYGPSARLGSGTRQPTSARLAFVGNGTSSCDAIMLFLYEESGAPFLSAVVPRIKYWASATADTDGDGISNANETALSTNPNSSDTDEDGLEDGWELEGYRWNGFQFFDSNLPMLGARARHKDVFVEVDYLSAADHNHRMHLESIYRAKTLYGQMAIGNPDGVNGVALRLINNDAINFDGGIGGVCGQRDYLGFFPDRKNRIYHWTIAGHGAGGQAEVASNRFVFGTGAGNPNGGSMSGFDKFVSFALLAHELGHNLGLVHEGRNGASQANCKANYPSLMNYAYDYSFNCSAYDLTATQIQFSNGAGPTLDENSLRESQTLPALRYVRGYDSDFLGCNALNVADNPGGGCAGPSLNIDWNRNGSYESSPVAVDITALGASSGCGADGLLNDQRDSNDFTSVAQYIDDSIRAPGRASCAGVGISSGFLHSRDTEQLQPVCGIPQYDSLGEHPWLKINPVFQLQPGMKIEHPAMQNFMRAALDAQAQVRADVSIQTAAPLAVGALALPRDAEAGQIYPQGQKPLE